MQFKSILLLHSSMLITVYKNINTYFSTNKDQEWLQVQRHKITIMPFIMNGRKNGVLRKLKHIFPNTYQRINSICSPAKVGLVDTDFNYQPGS